jgi:hypothetical protein
MIGSDIGMQWRWVSGWMEKQRGDYERGRLLNLDENEDDDDNKEIRTMKE